MADPPTGRGTTARSPEFGRHRPPLRPRSVMSAWDWSPPPSRVSGWRSTSWPGGCCPGAPPRLGAGPKTSRVATLASRDPSGARRGRPRDRQRSPPAAVAASAPAVPAAPQPGEPRNPGAATSGGAATTATDAGRAAEPARSPRPPGPAGRRALRLDLPAPGPAPAAAPAATAAPGHPDHAGGRAARRGVTALVLLASAPVRRVPVLLSAWDPVLGAGLLVGAFRSLRPRVDPVRAAGLGRDVGCARRPLDGSPNRPATCAWPRPRPRRSPRVRELGGSVELDLRKIDLTVPRGPRDPGRDTDRRRGRQRRDLAP